MSETETHEQQATEERADVQELIEVPVDEPNEDADEDAAEPIRALAIRHVLERQIVATQTLSEDLVEAVTDASVAIAHAPAAVVDEIKQGTTLPAALASSGTA